MVARWQGSTVDVIDCEGLDVGDSVGKVDKVLEVDVERVTKGLRVALMLLLIVHDCDIPIEADEVAVSDPVLDWLAVTESDSTPPGVLVASSARTT